MNIAVVHCSIGLLYTTKQVQTSLGSLTLQLQYTMTILIIFDC